MQVSSVDQHVTHAVIGNQESISMGMSDSSSLMHILSATLYTHPRLAAVREIICNGWDSHILAGITLPLVIEVTDTYLSVRDFGSGIPHDKIGPIYGTYGDSTKRDDDTVTGGFGLGSKAPFAYTDNFEVISCHAGVKTVYRVSKSSMEVGGKPSIHKIVSLETEETGIQVRMPIQAEHREEFINLIREVITFGEIKAILNEEDISGLGLPVSTSKTGYLITSKSSTTGGAINLRYGNVVYPIPESNQYEEEYDRIEGALEEFSREVNIIFMAPPDSITIAPSREALILSSNTVETIKSIMAKFIKQDLKISDLFLKEAASAKVNKAIKETVPSLAPAYFKKELAGGITKPEPYAETMRKALLADLLADFRTDYTEEDLFVLKLRHAIKSGVANTKFAKELLKATTKVTVDRRGYKRADKNVSKAFSLGVTYPLHKLCMEFPGTLSKKRMFVAIGAYSVTLHKVGSLDVRSIETAIPFLNKKVLLVRSQQAATEFLFKKRHSIDRASEGYIVYVCTNNVKSQQAAEKIFTDKGYAVEKCIPEPVKNGFVGPVIKAAKKPAVKRKGYISLNSCNDGVFFSLSTGRKCSNPDTEVSDPIAWVILNSGDSAVFNCYSPEACRIIKQNWGDKIAVVTTSQTTKLIERGVPNMTDFITTYVDEKLSAQPDFPRYLAFAKHFEERKDYRDHNTVIRYMCHHETLMKDLGLRVSVSPETEMLLTLYLPNRRGRYGVGNFTKCNVLSTKVAVNKKLVAKVEEGLTKSPWAKFIDMDALGSHLKKNSEHSGENEIPYEILRKLLK